MNRDRDRDLELAIPYDAPPPPPARYYPPPRRPESEFDWRLARGFLRGYKWTILGVFLTTILSGYATLSMLTELYDVEGEILVKLGRETLDPPATSRNTPLSTGLRHEDLMSEVQIMKSPVLVRRIVDDLGPEAFKQRRVAPEGLVARAKFEVKSAARWAKRQWKEALIALDLQKRLSDRDAAVQELIDGLSVEPRKESDVLAIRMRIADPALGVQVVQRLVDLYMERRVVVRRSEGVKEFLDARAAQRKAELQQAEMRRLALKRSQGLVSAAEQKALLLKQVEDVRADMIRTRSEIENLNRQIASGRDQVNATPQFERATEQTTPNPLLEKLRQQVADLRSERATLLTKVPAGVDPGEEPGRAHPGPGGHARPREDLPARHRHVAGEPRAAEPGAETAPGHRAAGGGEGGRKGAGRQTWPPCRRRCARSTMPTRRWWISSGSARSPSRTTCRWSSGKPTPTWPPNSTGAASPTSAS
jgi:uncharacterized protein involved in exopolysaccharide biosynthesis